MLNKNTTLAKIVLPGIDAVDVGNIGLALANNKDNKVNIAEISFKLSLFLYLEGTN